MKSAYKTPNSKRHKRDTNWSKLTDSKLSEILDSHHTTGTDGMDYAPYLDELLSEQYRRWSAQSLNELKQFEQDQKQRFKQLTAKRLA